MKTNPKHPAKYTKAFIPIMAQQLDGYERILDPMAGTGRVHLINDYGDHVTVGVEIEPEWALLHPQTIVGDALNLPFRNESFDGIAVSPVYGNRFSDHHNAKDGSTRRSYTHDMGRALHPNNSGTLHWGDKYKAFHEAAWAEAVRVLKPNGRFILNCKDHVRGGKVQPVTAWHLDNLDKLGLTLVDEIQVPVSGLRHGENSLARVGYETVAVLDKKTKACHQPVSTDATA